MIYTSGWRRAGVVIASLGVSLVAWDASALDASTDGASSDGASTDAASTDAASSDGGTCGSGLTCEFCDVSGYTPTTQQPPQTPTNACSSTDIQDFVTACFGSTATSQTCSAWQSSAPASCMSCIFTNQSASTWGALVCTSTSCSINTPGCVDLALNQTSQEQSQGGSGSCGDLINASYGCQDYACNTCPTNDGPPTSFDQCAQSAVANECASFVAPINSTTGPCSSLNGDGGTTASACFPTTTQDVPAFISYFCGSGSADGGTGNDGGSADGGTGTDAGIGTDGGVIKKDAGTSTDAGATGDGGTTFGSQGGCHCGVTSNSSSKAGALLAVLGLVAFAARRRRTEARIVRNRQSH